MALGRYDRRIQRGRKKVKVQLAWYSKEDEDTYHVCQRCPRYEQILSDNLRISTEERIIEYTNFDICSYCDDLINDGKDASIELVVSQR